MTCPSCIYCDKLEVALVHSGTGNASNAKRIVDLNGSYKTRTLNMKGGGASAKVNDAGLLNLLGNKRTLIFEASTPDDQENLVENKQDTRLDLEMLRQFGSDIGSVGAIASEISNLEAAGTLSSEEKQDIIDIIQNLGDLVKLNQVEQTSDVKEMLLEKLSDVIESLSSKITKTLRLATIPVALASALSSLIGQIAHQNKIELTSESNLLNLNDIIQTIETKQSISTALNTILKENPSLSSADVKEIKELIAQIENDQDITTPLPSEIVDKISRTVEKISISNNTPSIIQKIAASVSTLITAAISGVISPKELQSTKKNILTALNDAKNQTAANQIRQIEATIARIEKSASPTEIISTIQSIPTKTIDAVPELGQIVTATQTQIDNTIPTIIAAEAPGITASISTNDQPKSVTPAISVIETITTDKSGDFASTISQQQLSQLSIAVQTIRQDGIIPTPVAEKLDSLIATVALTSAGNKAADKIAFQKADIESAQQAVEKQSIKTSACGHVNCNCTNDFQTVANNGTDTRKTKDFEAQYGQDTVEKLGVTTIRNLEKAEARLEQAIESSKQELSIEQKRDQQNAYAAIIAATKEPVSANPSAQFQAVCAQHGAGCDGNHGPGGHHHHHKSTHEVGKKVVRREEDKKKTARERSLTM